MSTTDPWRNPRLTSNLGEAPHNVPRKNMVLAWLRVWWPALLWAAVIFGASTDAFSSERTSRFIDPVLRWLFPSASQDSIFCMHHLVRKAAHFVEYFVFFVLLYRGIRRSRPGWHWSWAFAAWFIAALYSALDEFHQTFVASRGPSAWDSLLDSTGALVALFTVFFLYRRFQRARAS
jgi:VanZ family protein